ncbi:MAG: NAD(P)H-hydrate dehydratase [Acidobacteriota bacterium]
MEVLDAARMRRADAIAIDEYGIPGLVLMEHAGLRTAEVMADEIDALGERPVTVVCGRGNNGGDGFVVARHLHLAGCRVRAVLVGAARDTLRGDAAAMAAAFAGIGGELVEARDAAGWEPVGGSLDAADVVVDALFGTGLTRPVRGLAARVIDDVNRSGATVVAVDLPSGLDASRPQPIGPAIDADLTVTFARPKPAHLLPPAEDLAGDVVVVDIGIPSAAIARTAPDLHWMLAEEVAELVPERAADDHKGRCGHVLVVGGSTGHAGAAALAGLGALVGGAGLVTVAAPRGVRPEVAGFAPELMTADLPASRDGSLAAGAAARALELASERDVLAVGPGLGRAAPTPAQVRRLVRDARCPVVLDADGINAFAGRAAASLARHRGPLVLTPHPGEASRILGLDVAEIQHDRLAAARLGAERFDAVFVLKGYRTVVAEPGGRAFINPTGNPGMATGGMGDVLTGLIAGLLGQGLEPLDAALLGVFVHGLAADLALAGGETEQTLTAGAVLEHLAEAFDRLEPDDEEA